MERSQKEKLVETLHHALADTSCLVVTHQTGLTVAEVTELRRQMRVAGASFKVTKNRLVRLALAGAVPVAAHDGDYIRPLAVATARAPPGTPSPG